MLHCCPLTAFAILSLTLALGRNKFHVEPTGLPLQGIETRRLIARGMAQQWFGGLMRPATAADGWLLEGLAGWAEDHYLRTFMGANELAYRLSLAALSILPSGHDQTLCCSMSSGQDRIVSISFTLYEWTLPPDCPCCGRHTCPL